MAHGITGKEDYGARIMTAEESPNFVKRMSLELGPQQRLDLMPRQENPRAQQAHMLQRTNSVPSCVFLSKPILI